MSMTFDSTSTPQTPISMPMSASNAREGDRESALAMGVGDFLDSYEKACSKQHKKGMYTITELKFDCISKVFDIVNCTNNSSAQSSKRIKRRLRRWVRVILYDESMQTSI